MLQNVVSLYPVFWVQEYRICRKCTHDESFYTTNRTWNVQLDFTRYGGKFVCS